MAPLDLSEIAGTLPYYLIYMAIGMGFGATLELAGFGDSRKLAGQFYLRDMTVLKVMFTGIIVAAVLIGASSASGIMDMSGVWVNPTYLLPGIVGGLIMGVGFIIGGFCPGTSVVAASTLKIDGIFFLGGVGLGTLAFSETVGDMTAFWHSTFMGRFTLGDLFSLPVGVVIVLLVAMALFMFLLAELSERVFGGGEKPSFALLRPKNRKKMAGAASILGVAVIFAFVGQPDLTERWTALAETSGVELKDRAPYIHPAEVVEWREDPSVYVRVIDVRSRADFNRFHLAEAQNVTPDQVTDAAFLKELKGAPDNTLVFVTSNGETDSTAAWKILKAAKVANAYIIEGGLNNWLKLYPPDPCIATPAQKSASADDEELVYVFRRSVGSNCYSSHPEAAFHEPPTDCYMATHPELDRDGAKKNIRPNPFKNKKKPTFERKVKMKKKAALKGGCG